MKRLLVLCAVMATITQQSVAMQKKIVYRNFTRSGRAFAPVDRRGALLAEGPRDEFGYVRFETKDSRVARLLEAEQMRPASGPAVLSAAARYKLQLLGKKAGLIESEEEALPHVRSASRLGLMFLHDRGEDETATVFPDIVRKLKDIGFINTQGEIDQAVIMLMKQAIIIESGQEENIIVRTTPVWDQIINEGNLPVDHESIKYEIDRAFAR